MADPRGGARGARPKPAQARPFKPNLGPLWPQKNFGDRPPILSQGLDPALPGNRILDLSHRRPGSTNSTNPC